MPVPAHTFLGSPLVFPPVPLQLEAPTTSHLSSTLPPEGIVLGLAVKETIFGFVLKLAISLFAGGGV